MTGENSIEENLCCVNCSESFKIDQFSSDEHPSLENDSLSNFVREFRVPLLWTQEEDRVVTVFDALSSIYNLHPVLTTGEMEKNLKFMYNNNNITICTGCAHVLTNLYKYYIQFNHLRQVNSFLAQKIQDLDSLLKGTVSSSIICESNDHLDHDVKPALVELQPDNVPMEVCGEDNFGDLSPPGSYDDHNDPVPHVSIVPQIPAGPWINLVRLTPQEILSATTTTSTTTKRRRKTVQTKFQVETFSDDDSIDQNDDVDFNVDEVGDEDADDEDFMGEVKPKLNVKYKFKRSKSNSDQISKRRQKLHEEKIQNSRKSVKCPTCDKICSGTWSLKMHTRVHTLEKPYGCHKCGLRFAQSSAYYGHLRRRHGPEDFSKAITIAKSTRKPRVVEVQPKKYHCDSCYRSFARAFDLKTHNRIHTQEKPYYCRLCDRNFSQNSALKRHEKIFHQPPPDATAEEAAATTTNNTDQSKLAPFLCPICGLTFIFKSRLEGHMLFHEESRNFKCRTCDMSFKSLSIRTRHEMIHKEVKSFLCTQCGKTFSQRQGLKIHMQTHTGEKPYKCKICEQGFGYNQTLKKHIAKCHGEEYLHLAGIERNSRKPPASCPPISTHVNPTVPIEQQQNTTTSSDV